MKNGDRETVKTAVVNPRGEILVLTRSLKRQYRPGGLDWPGGGLEKGELALEAAVREIYEETGLVVGSLIALSNDEPRRHLFAALEPNPPEVIMTSHEHSMGIWVPLPEFLDLEIPDKYKLVVQNNLPVFDRLIQGAMLERETSSI